MRRFILLTCFGLLVSGCQGMQNNSQSAELREPATIFVGLNSEKNGVFSSRVEIAYSGRNWRNYSIKNNEQWISHIDRNERCTTENVCLRKEIFNIDLTREQVQEGLRDGLLIESKIGGTESQGRIDRLRFSANDLRFSLRKLRADQEVNRALGRNRLSP